MAAREGTGSGGGAAETRAAQSVLGGARFRAPAAARAESASGAVAQRWAPEGAAVERAPAMRALRFADRHLSAYLGTGHPVHGQRADRSVPPVNWLFPIPWFGDEFGWLSAARAAAQESARAAWRAGEVAQAAASRPGAGARQERGAAAVREETRVDRPASFVGLPVELVAPAFAAALPPRRGGRFEEGLVAAGGAMPGGAAAGAASSGAMAGGVSGAAIAGGVSSAASGGVSSGAMAGGVSSAASGGAASGGAASGGAAAGGAAAGAAGSWSGARSPGGASAGRAGSASRAAWRAYTPLVDGAAARAAEFLAELVFRTQATEEARQAAWRPAPLLELVTPVEMASGAGRDPGTAARLAEAGRRDLEERRAALAIRLAAQAAAAAGRVSAGAASAGGGAAGAGQAAGGAPGGASAGAVTASLAAGSARAAAAADSTAAATAAARGAAASKDHAARARASAGAAERTAAGGAADQGGAAAAARAAAAALAGQTDARVSGGAESGGAESGTVATAGAADVDRPAAGAGAAGAAPGRAGAADLEAARAAAIAAAQMASAAAVAGPGTLARQASASSAASAAGSGGDSGELGGVGASAIERALELLAANLAAGGAEWLAPAAGPRVLLPAGLGGFVAGSAAARAVGLPAASAAGTARVWPAALTEPLGGGRPAALDHVLWADRWLARFAGASPAALRSFDAARAGSPGASSFESAFASPFAAPFASVGQLRTGEWSPAWVAPRADTPAAARLAAGGGVASSARSSMTAAVPARADASSPDAQAPEVRRAIIVDDDEPVADSVFSAIAAEAAAHRQRARGGARRADGPRAASVPSRPPVPAGPSVPAGPFRPPLADRALAGFPLGGSPGLAAGLAASPLASILSGLLELAPQPAFDPRTLSLTALGDFLARGAVAARALGGAGGGDDAAPASVAAALQRLAGSAPGWVWLSLADGGGSGGALAAARAGWSAAGHQGPGMSGGPGRAPGGESQGAIDMSAAAGLSGGPQGESTPTAAAATGPSGITGALGIAGPSGTAGALGIAGALASPGLRQGHAWPSLVGPAGEAAPWSEALGPSAPRPGDIGTRAESFADARTIAASDLALDFLAPEILAAARAAGMGPIEAGRAQRLAASGLPHLMALAMAVDRVFVHALSPGHAGAIDRAGAAGAAGAAAASAAAAAGSAAAASTGGPAGAASASAAAAAGGAWPLAATGGDSAGRTDAAPAALRAAAALERSAPARLPRGAFLLPGAAARALGVSAGAAESLRPNIAAALDLVAASHVAEAAAAASLPASAIDTADTGVATAASLSTLAAMAGAASGSASAAGQEPGAPGVPGVPDVIGERDAAAAWSVPAEAARAQLPHELWPVFDAVYLSLGESAETRPLAPSARAARALALASRSAAASVSSASARARAAAAWAVLPVILTGGAEPSTGAGAAGAGEPVSSRAASAARSSAVARAGDALGALVAPTILMADGRADREQAASGFTREGSPRGNVSSPARASDTPFIDTGAGPRAPITSSPQPASRAAAPAPAPGAALSAADMAWFQEAAKKYFDSAGPTTGGISLAEMTLVTSAPRTQIAASAKAADRGVVQASSTTPTGGEGNQPDGVPLPGRPDIDKIAQDVFEQICRMMAVARERSGDPWQR